MDNFENIIDYLAQLLGKQFSADVSTIYFGDVGIYPPRAFQDALGKPTKAVIALVPRYDRFDEANGRTMAGEFRRLGLHVLVLVNMTPYFEAMPQEAFGERILVRLVARVRQFLSLDEHVTLGGRVLSSSVGDVNWNWIMRDADFLRAAAIDYEVVVFAQR